MVDENPDALIERMVNYMHKIRETAFNYAKIKWKYVVDELTKQIESMTASTVENNFNSENVESGPASQTLTNHLKYKNVFNEFMKSLNQKECEGDIPYNDFSEEKNEYENNEEDEKNDDPDDFQTDEDTVTSSSDIEKENKCK